MDYQQIIKCKECGLVLNSLESLEVHRQYHEGRLIQQWTQNSSEEKNNNQSKESPEYSSNTQEAFYPPTPQSYQSSHSPYQTFQEYSFSNFPVKSELPQQDYLGFYQEANLVGYQTQNKFLNNRYNPYNRPVYSVNYPPQPTPSPSPKQCDKCGLVCESAQLLIEHNNLSHPYYYETPKEEEVSQSEILDLDSQKVVSQTWEKDKLLPNWGGDYQGEFPQQQQGSSSSQVYESPVVVAPPPAVAPTKSTNWKSNEARRPKTYNCTACNKWFTSSGHLKRHYNTTLHKNAVKSSGLPDPATMPISAHHHPARDSSASKDNGQEDSRSSDSVVDAVPTMVEQYPNELAPHVTQATPSTTGDLEPLPSFAQIQAQLHANVGGMGQQYYCPQEYLRPVLIENTTLTNLPPVELPVINHLVLEEEQKENPPIQAQQQPPPPPPPPPQEEEERKTKCYDCDKVFNRPCYLTQHNKTFHNGDKPFKCSRCGKRFPDDDTYRKHARKHAGDKPHKCDMCPKMFNHKTDLRRHLCCHTGRKPYACEICGKGFIRKDHMIKHVDTHTRKREKMAAIRS